MTPQQVASGHAAIDKPTADYEAKPKNGTTQSNFGETNVHLAFPP